MPFPFVSFVVFILSFIGFTDSTVPDFECWNFKSTNALRNEYYKTVNDYRRLLAKGEANNVIGTCPAGTNIYNLDWDCFLEIEAEKMVRKRCFRKDTSELKNDTILLKVVKTADTCYAKPLLTGTVNEWWKIVQDVGLPTGSTIFDTEMLKGFATLANGRATKVGCAQKNCDGDLYIACAFNAKTPELETEIYSEGAGCKQDKECKTYADSKCVDRLCFLGYIDPNAPTTTSTTTTITTTTTTTTTTTLANNKMCPGNPVTDAVRTMLLNQHNAKRGKLARGELWNKKTSRNAPSARRMLKLKYDCEAEKGAYKWAKKCLDQQAPPSERPGYTENRYITKSMYLDFMEAAKLGIADWWGQFARYGAPADNIFQWDLRLNQFAKMAWDSNNRLGCAVVRCTWMINTVCRYAPGGAKPGQLIYKMGPECSGCSGLPCAEGLCVES